MLTLMSGYCLAYLVIFQDWLLFLARLVAFPLRISLRIFAVINFVSVAQLLHVLNQPLDH
jgi:hypothetical protein